MHRERRHFLRGALKELYKVLEDEPGLLGPKVEVMTIRAALKESHFITASDKKKKMFPPRRHLGLWGIFGD